jgi:hypothetical protein
MRDNERSAVFAVEPRRPLVLQDDDEGGDVVDGDLIDPAPAEVRDQVLAKRPAVYLAGPVARRLPFEPGKGVLSKALRGRFDPLTAMAAQPQLSTPCFCFDEAAVNDLPAAPPGGVKVGDLVRWPDTAAGTGPVVDAGVTGDRPPPRALVSLRLHRSITSVAGPGALRRRRGIYLAGRGR